MKLISLVVSLCIVGAFSTPINKYEPSQQRWVTVPDQNGNMHVVDLKSVEGEVEPSFDAMTDVIFRLFTRANPTAGQIITFDMNTVRNSNWNANHDVRILIHGWNGGGAGTNAMLRNEFLARGEYNVIAVDWGAGAQTPNYVAARNRVGPTGEAIAVLIDAIHAEGMTTFARVNVVGHSLGSHVGGHIGKAVTGGRINAIFGTDAAGPLFFVGTPNERFDIGDAVYTENIHTNAGSLGFDQPITHAAFYPAWGSNQPGCNGDNSCSHGRSNTLYAESLRLDLLVGRQCASYDEIVAQNCPGTGVTGLLGGDFVKTIRGVFFLETNSVAPFGRG